MRIVIALVFCVIGVAQLGGAGAQSDRAPSSEHRVVLNKHQLAALEVAIREMHKSGRSFHGQQVRIEDQGKNFHVTFMDDPIDMRVAGSQNGITWEIRKDDLKVLRWFLDR